MSSHLRKSIRCMPAWSLTLETSLNDQIKHDVQKLDNYKPPNLLNRQRPHRVKIAIENALICALSKKMSDPLSLKSKCLSQS